MDFNFSGVGRAGPHPITSALADRRGVAITCAEELEQVVAAELRDILSAKPMMQATMCSKFTPILEKW